MYITSRVTIYSFHLLRLMHILTYAITRLLIFRHFLSHDLKHYLTYFMILTLFHFTSNLDFDVDFNASYIV